MIKKIGIIGCGWLGLPLAEELVAKGYTINGTTTSEDKLKTLRNKDINPFKILISEEQIEGPILEFLEGISLLIINIPPGLRGKGPKESYVSKISLLHLALKKTGVKQVIFVSSTSVYGDTEGMVTEKTKPIPSTASGKQLLKCEELFSTDTTLSTTIIRFGGLIGSDRHPISMLTGRENLNGGNAPINLIHLDDCIGIIKAIIVHEQWDGLLNAVYPYHPTKKKYYTEQALKRGLVPPQYVLKNIQSGKFITTCSSFLIKNYRFLTPIN